MSEISPDAVVAYEQTMLSLTRQNYRQNPTTSTLGRFIFNFQDLRFSRHAPCVRPLSLSGIGWRPHSRHRVVAAGTFPVCSSQAAVAGRLRRRVCCLWVLVEVADQRIFDPFYFADVRKESLTRSFCLYRTFSRN